jgi:DNA sulfur modification protein DndC
MNNTQQLATNQPPQRTVSELVEDIQMLSQEIRDLYCLDAIPWVIGYSGGKDSSVILQLWKSEKRPSM